MNKRHILFILVLFSFSIPNISAQAKTIRAQWEMMNLIRKEKFETILPKVMRENKIDMWIHVMRGGNRDPLYIDLGGSSGYFIFTDRGGDRIERAVLGGRGYTLHECGAYDFFGSTKDLRKYITERDPQRIAINMSEKIAIADGLSHTGYLKLITILGKTYSERLVSAEKLIADFRSRRAASEIVAFGYAGELTRIIAERALSNEVIIPGVTTLKDVSWWMQGQLLAYGGTPSLDPPAVYIRYADHTEISSNDHIIMRGDIIKIDWGVNIMNFSCDIKRIGYVLREGETAVPPGIQHAFDQALKVRKIIRRLIKPGRTAAEILEIMYQKVKEAGFVVMRIEDNITDTEKTEVTIGSHSVGNRAHCIGPSIFIQDPWQIQFTIQPTNLFAFEFFAYTPVAELGGEKLRIGLEDNVIVTERGVEYLYPPIDRILLIR